MTGEKRLTRTSGKAEDKNPQQPRSAAVNVLSGKMLYRRRALNTQETHGYESQVSPCGRRSSELEEGTVRTPVPVGAETEETDVYALHRCVGVGKGCWGADALWRESTCVAESGDMPRPVGSDSGRMSRRKRPTDQTK